VILLIKETVFLVGDLVMVRVSVCMTTYNGERYIYKQIKSILEQIQENDEIIVCDDQSSDSTTSIISSFQDKRIKIIINEKNLGFSKNFSKCISLAEGNFIFLSDHDDIWLPGKIEKYLSIFQEKSDVVSIMSNMEIINENDEVINPRLLNLRSGYNNRFVRVIQNFIKSTYYGCSIAFRKELRSKILPLPFHFDTWIGLVSDIYGKCYHMNEVTMQYRRHSNNFSTLKTSKVHVILRWRLNLLLNLCTLIIGNRDKLVDNSFLNLLDI
jgi:glycosyltransferase involved in cell wall biosynthesis